MADEPFRTEHMRNRAKQMYENLYRAVEVLAIFEPYTYQSDYFAHSTAAEALAKALPEPEQKEFMAFVREKIKGKSNYSGD